MHVVYKSQILSFTFFNPKICIAMVLKKKKMHFHSNAPTCVFNLVDILLFHSL